LEGEQVGADLTVRFRRLIIIGSGLIGTSIALAVRDHCADVVLSDRDPAAARLAASIGAGTALPGGPATYRGAAADLAVLAVPPAEVPVALFEAQKHGVARAYTDVASVKQAPMAEAAGRDCDLATFIGGHPLGGREKSGPLAARAGLFLGRPWVLCPTGESTAATVAAATALARACGARPVLLEAAAHDQAMALISHAPHAVASAMAARFVDIPEPITRLAGQGARDVTRIAAGNPLLWLGIMSANAHPLADVLDDVARDLAGTAAALRTAGDTAVTDLLVRGLAGHGRIHDSQKAEGS
jgi:prephenate dehydrogenase